jgi:hypothetical protein
MSDQPNTRSEYIKLLNERKFDGNMRAAYAGWMLSALSSPRITVLDWSYEFAKKYEAQLKELPKA